jgi:hypothetical protein
VSGHELKSMASRANAANNFSLLARSRAREGAHCAACQHTVIAHGLRTTRT